MDYANSLQYIVVVVWSWSEHSEFYVASIARRKR